jgi:hypothetical protein
MENSEELLARMMRAAKWHIKQGGTSKELFEQAKQQREMGLEISADYTSLLASTVRQLETKKSNGESHDPDHR